MTVQGTGRQHLDAVLRDYTNRNPKLATFTGDRFIIRPRRLGPLMKLAFAITGFVMVLFIAMGLLVIVVGVVGDDIDSPGLMIAGGVGFILFAVALIALLVVSRLTRGIIDLTTGDFCHENPLRTRRVLNMADVTAYNRFDMGMAGPGVAPINVLCQVHYTVQGKNGPKTKKVALAVFNKAQAYDDFEPVVNSLIGYFRGQR